MKAMFKKLVIKILDTIDWIFAWVVTPLSVIIMWSWVLTPFIIIMVLCSFISDLSQEEEDRQLNQTGKSIPDTAWDKPIV